MVENALYDALDIYNKQVGGDNTYDRNWGSLFNFIGKLFWLIYLKTDTDDTSMLAEYSTRKTNLPPPKKVLISCWNLLCVGQLNQGGYNKRYGDH